MAELQEQYLKKFFVGKLDSPVKAGDDKHGWRESNFARVLYREQMWFYDLPDRVTSELFEAAAQSDFVAYSWCVFEGEYMRVDLEDEPMPTSYDYDDED